VHEIRPGVAYDPAAIQAVPLDGLTQRYLMADEARAFRVDLPDGEYVLTLIAPALAASTVPVQVGEVTLRLGGASATEAQIDVTVAGGSLEIVVGGAGPWALAGLVIRSRAPEIAHLPPAALPGEQDARLTATVTAPDGVRSVRLRYQVAGVWREAPMEGDGSAFSASVPADELGGDRLAYEIVAESTTGLTAERSARAAVVHGFQAPRVTAALVPETWSPEEPLVVRLSLENGRYARELRAHYREADQNRDFRTATLAGRRSGEYAFEIDTRRLDGAYELLVYIEVIDALGGGSFYPDPFREARTFVLRPRAMGRP
jgi:hypothetical protein